MGAGASRSRSESGSCASPPNSLPVTSHWWLEPGSGGRVYLREAGEHHRPGLALFISVWSTVVKYLLPRSMQRRWKAVRRGRAPSSEPGPADGWLCRGAGGQPRAIAGVSLGERPWGSDVEPLSEQGETRARHLADSQGPRGGERCGQGREHDHHVTRRSLEQNDACEVLKGQSHPLSQQPHRRCSVETRKPVSVQKPVPGVPQQLYLLRMSLDR